MLHVTSGDVGVSKLRESNFLGEIISWRDVLHEGPVPDLPAEQLIKVRAAYIGKRGWADTNTTYKFLLQRNQQLLEEPNHVCLWFEPDLYDQLQLLQVLDLLFERNNQQVKVSFMQAPTYFEELQYDDFQRLYFQRAELAPRSLAIASRLWKAFCSAEPQTLAKELQAYDLSLFPFLDAAIRRLLEEFPSSSDGLGRTERQILTALWAGERSMLELFVANQEMEQWKYLSDLAFADYVERLADADYPLICNADRGIVRSYRHAPDKQEFWRQSVLLTKTGKDILDEKLSHVVVNGIDRWIGGVHLRKEPSVAA